MKYKFMKDISILTDEGVCELPNYLPPTYLTDIIYWHTNTLLVYFGNAPVKLLLMTAMQKGFSHIFGEHKISHVKKTGTAKLL